LLHLTQEGAMKTLVKTVVSLSAVLFVMQACKIDLGALGATSSATDINERGVAVGASNNSAVIYKAMAQ
jgi:uncharacterized membrane protein